MRSRLIPELCFSCSFAFIVTGILGATLVVRADSFDWQNVGGQNWNSAIESQFGGTSWDFSSCATLEAKYMISRNDCSFVPNVSEQQVC
jgi:hypothetical protein